MERRKLCRTLGAAVLFVLWTVCALRVNRAYPQAQTVQAGAGEPLSYESFTITLTAARIEDTAALYTENGLSAEGMLLPEKTLLCTVAVRQAGAEERDGRKLFQAAAVSGAWQSAAERGALYTALNSDASDSSHILPDAPQTWFFPFGLYREAFSAESWAHLSEKTFALQFSLYPQKVEILFQPEMSALK